MPSLRRATSVAAAAPNRSSIGGAGTSTGGVPPLELVPPDDELEVDDEVEDELEVDELVELDELVLDEPLLATLPDEVETLPDEVETLPDLSLIHI